MGVKERTLRLVKQPSPQAVKSAYGAALRKFRHAAGLSQMKLADRAGIHFTYLADAERGKRNIGLVNIVRIVAALGISLDRFFREVEVQLAAK